MNNFASKTCKSYGKIAVLICTVFPFLSCMNDISGRSNPFDLNNPNNIGKCRIITVNYANNGALYKSLDGGTTWFPKASIYAHPVRSASAIASSADGTKLVATWQVGYLYTSSDSGNTWVWRNVSGDTNYWSSVVTSADGSKILASDYKNGAQPSSGYLYYSSNSGVSWIQETSFGMYYCSQVAMSSDGKKMAAQEAGLGHTYIFTNGGGSGGWGNSGNLDGGTSHQFNAVVYSADGTRLIVAAQMDYIYTSTDDGVSWTKRTGAGTGVLTLAVSSNGMRIIAVDNQNFTVGYIYTSVDGGATWVQRTSAGLRYWRGVACTPDGMNVVAGVNAGYLYSSSDGGVTWKELAGVTTACISLVIYK